MILADTSIWADHLGRGDARMASLLDADAIVTHAYVIGEIAMGNLKQRARILADLRDLPTAPIAGPHELLVFIERHALFGTGIGYVDAHLLASTLLTPGMTLWTRDKRLMAAAQSLGIAAHVAM